MKSSVETSQRDASLEALRGLAALAVVIWHAKLMFASVGATFWPKLQITHLVYSGGSAVMFFFMLSGYVLTRKYIENRNSRYLANSVLKRYFRLVGPVLLSCLISAALFKSGLYRYLDVAAITKSPWTQSFGYSIPDNINFRPSFHGAVIQGIFYLMFVPYHQYYNSALWTIYFETVGSYLVFAIAFLIVFFRKVGRSLITILWFLLMASAVRWSLTYFQALYFAAFLMGLGISVVISWEKLRFSTLLTWLLIVLAVLFLSFESPTREYAFLSHFGVTTKSSPYFAFFGSFILIIAFEGNASMRSKFSGRVCIFLGKLSFPIYLIHFLVLASLGCFTWLYALKHYGPTAAEISAISASVVGSVIFALPLITFDRWWTITVNRIALKVTASAILPKHL